MTRQKPDYTLDYSLPAESGASGVSVIVQHYNRPWLLEIAVLAIKRQLERERIAHEIILADDGSDRDIWTAFDHLPFDRVVIQQHRFCDGTDSSVYHTLAEALNGAREPYIFYLQDDFWLVPQGFIDSGKSHLRGLKTRPDFEALARPITGAALLLQEREDAHFVELSRSFLNARYNCLPGSARRHAEVEFRAKCHRFHPLFYSCDWPHMQRAADMRAVQLPAGMAIWRGETALDARRCEMFGEGDWVYNASRCFFAHINVFTWRAVFKDGLKDAALAWSDVDARRSVLLPFGNQTTTDTNAKLMAAYVSGQIKNDFAAYCEMTPLDYLRTYLWDSLKLKSKHEANS